MTPRVALVIVSHSDLLARGVVEVAAQMAPDVTLETAGGTADGSIGTSFDRVEAAVGAALKAVDRSQAGGGVLVLTDLGSATLTVDSVLEFCEDDDQVVFVEAPLVEGAVAAAVQAQMGSSLGEVVDAARQAGAVFAAAADGAGEPRASRLAPTRVGGPLGADASVPVVRTRYALEAGAPVEADATVWDPVGLHARPAALLARLIGTFDAEVRVNDADATSVLELMALGIRRGERVHLVATGPQASEAVTAAVSMLEEPGVPTH